MREWAVTFIVGVITHEKIIQENHPEACKEERSRIICIAERLEVGIVGQLSKRCSYRGAC